MALDLILVEASHNGALGLRYQYWLFYTRKVAQSVAFRISLNKNNFDSKSTGGRARRIEIVLWWNRIRTDLQSLASREKQWVNHLNLRLQVT